MSLLAVGAFQAWVDPYALLRPDLTNKVLPFNTYYNYNLVRHRDQIQVGFLGSSAVNYFALQQYDPQRPHVFAMGIESSNMFEHVTYGRALVEAGAREVVIFVTFYALNPDRPNQPYFNSAVSTLNSKPIDFVHQYLTWGAVKDSLKHLRRQRSGNVMPPQFRLDGSRTQRHYLDQADYTFESQAAEYLAWLELDRGYYGSERFRDPSSIDAGVTQLREYLSYLDRRGVAWRLATSPIHRSALALIYSKGLGPTFERHREALAELAPFVDVNLNVELCSRDSAFWDTHHVRDGEAVINSLSLEELVVTPANAKRTASLLKPTAEERAWIEALRGSHAEVWNRVRERLVELGAL